MTRQTTWEQLKRTLVYDSKFLKVYQDSVRLPNGSVVDDYTVVEKPSIVMIVATTDQGKLVVLNEYKYAAGEILKVLPAGHKKEQENSIDAAKRELLEETGFSGDEFEDVGILRDYPTKDLHRVYVVRAKGVVKTAEAEHEETESITYELVTIDDLKAQIGSQEWKSSSALAALTLAGVLF